METFCAVARYKGEGRMLQFTVLSSWEIVMGDISERWALDGSPVRVKFVIPDSYKTLCPIESYADFQRMRHIHHTFNKTVVDIIIKDASGSMDDNSGLLIPSKYDAVVKTYLSQHPPAGALSIVQSSQSLDRVTVKVGQRFDNVVQFKDCLRSNAIRQNFDFTFIKNDKLRVTIKCAAPNCQWRVHASKEGNVGTLKVKTMQATHNYGGGIGTTDHGVRLPYKHAWMGKEIARAAIHAKELGCRPLLFVDGTHLLGKYDMILLGATARDSNEGIFHVAFTLVDNETDDNWTWFLATLGETLYGEDDYDKVITFISDRSKGLVNAVSRVFPSSPHGYCLRHLGANFMKVNDSLGKSLKEQCWSVIVKITYAYTSKEFDDAVIELVAISTDAYDWLLHKSNIDHWCNYLFKGIRWCKMYSNVAESFNAWIKEARHLQVTSMIDTIRFKLMNMLTERREVSAMWDTYLCPEIHKKVEQIVEIIRFSRVGPSSDDTYEVVDEHNNAANLRLRKCSCRRWDIHGLPCKHATAAIMQTDTNVHYYVDQYFTAESYRRAYAEPIYPIPDSDKSLDDARQLRMRPSIAKKRPGRPRRKQIELQALDLPSLIFSTGGSSSATGSTSNIISSIMYAARSAVVFDFCMASA
ncbi:uncharacterized protein LOC120274955 [Dioscorea cayenensis subsp. rotundata]|uniref:Uncharacterized protein LOC120274955 n=1 Tax=Dioscorea cayennensis subsp. rotundata TaxID=55577 RepID=A0AB40CBZ2_DIOCR|nr:uncharacterized protein LOC120274955 [Dioscorea cayenensis subsp. rotundata]